MGSSFFEVCILHYLRLTFGAGIYGDFVHKLKKIVGTKNFQRSLIK